MNSNAKYSPETLSIMSKKRLEFVQQKCSFIVCKNREHCESNGYVCPAMVLVNTYKNGG